MGTIQRLAIELGADERTLRRAAASGAIHCDRPGPRRTRLSAAEVEYLRGHWGLLFALRQALRTQRSVRLAVAYGSVARGDEDAGSDLDLLLALSDDEPHMTLQLARRLSDAAGRPVDIGHLDRIRESAPLLLTRVLDDGRVIVDRDGIWTDLHQHRRAIRARAKRSYQRQMDEAAQAIKELTA